MKAVLDSPGIEKGELYRQTSVSELLPDKGSNRIYAILRRLAERVTALELATTALKRDAWRIEQKQSRDSKKPPSLQSNFTPDPKTNDYQGMFGIE